MSNFVLIDARRPLPQFGTDPDISMDSEGLDISFQTALPNIVEVLFFRFALNDFDIIFNVSWLIAVVIT